MSEKEIRCQNCNELWTKDDIAGDTCPNCGKHIAAVTDLDDYLRMG